MKNSSIVSTCLSGTYRMAYVEQSRLKTCERVPATYDEVKLFGFPCVDAKVPGHFETSLYAAGVIDDPYYASNTLEYEKFENYHVFYSREFDYQPQEGCTPVLRFEGLDTIADVYLNGVKLARTENMFIAHNLPAEGIREGKNELFVHFLPVCLEARNNEITPQDISLRYNFDQLTVRKAAHMYGWDILPRAVSCGIWRDVYLDLIPQRYVKEAYFYTKKLAEDHSEAECALFFRFELSDDPIKEYGFTLEGRCGDSVITYSDVCLFNQGTVELKVKAPKLWWPVGRGEQNLYDFTLTLLRNGTAVDTYTFRTGIRTARLDYSAVLDENGKGDFVFVINGEKTFIKGSNWVPADAYHTADRQRIPQCLDLWTECGCNALRSWGGGVYEDHEFFDLCDEKGIIVWQDFAMGCATYPQHEKMQRVLREEAVAVVKKLRMHPSICLWAGDNEIDYFMAYLYNVPPQHNVLTRKVLPEVTAAYDGTRTYLPSSPYVSPEAYELHDDSRPPEQHLWGPRDYFKSDFYRNAKALFASELGYHGCPSPDSMKKFLRPEMVWTGYEDNRDWMTHASCVEMTGPYNFRNNLMRSHIKTLWGIDEVDNLDDFARASQASQAEAKKYFMERFRCRKWDRTGVIWWNMIDGWPQISDAIVDYYYTKKLAFSYLQRSQREVCMMFDEPEGGKLRLVAVNDTRDAVTLSYRVLDLTEGAKQVAEGRVELAGDAAQTAAFIDYDGANRFYHIVWELDGKQYTNHYLAGNPPYDFNWYLNIIRSLGYDCYEGFGEKR
ncbi:MAG: hypothetical protein IJC25_07395 [Clostridia bacterium]|nr:hypothetical protein [Clostridia bacterium]